ncbi:MAG: formylglycine-generating enzyme family protein [Myxococcaceae bacterium]|nr:formylglycine-generating enzyme family protein [Myxococcaceae bacterium]
MVRLAALAIGVLLSSATRAEGVLLPEGRFAPLFGLDKGQRSFAVAAFRLDRRLVTEAAFAAFLRSKPEWSSASVKPALADERYLSQEGGAAYAQAPQTRVSWFAAQAYCEWRGGRLPTTLEWEYAAAADEKVRDASTDAAFVKRILTWYGKPFRREDLLGSGSLANVYGVEQLHGLVWEWTLDFNGTFMTSDNRQDGDRVNALTCGNGATGSARREDYAAFMRYALRSSLSARSTLANLGFRCAYPATEERSP